MISFSIDWKGLALPFAYLIVLSGALMTFSTIYRKRRAGMRTLLLPPVSFVISKISR